MDRLISVARTLLVGMLVFVATANVTFEIAIRARPPAETHRYMPLTHAFLAYVLGVAAATAAMIAERWWQHRRRLARGSEEALPRATASPRAPARSSAR